MRIAAWVNVIFLAEDERHEAYGYRNRGLRFVSLHPDLLAVEQHDCVGKFVLGCSGESGDEQPANGLVEKRPRG